MVSLTVALSVDGPGFPSQEASSCRGRSGSGTRVVHTDQQEVTSHAHGDQSTSGPTL